MESLLAVALVVSLLVNLAAGVFLVAVRLDLSQMTHDYQRLRDTTTELVDVNASVIRESSQRGEVIESLRAECRTWQHVAGELQMLLQSGRWSVVPAKRM